MCVQLVDSTIRYPVGIVKNLLVQVKDSFILADFVVIDMEGDLGILLILRQPFLRDAKGRIDIRAQKISLRIRGRNMNLRFQNSKEQTYLIHEDAEGQGLGAKPTWKNWEIHSLLMKLSWEDWEIHSFPSEDPSPTPPATPKKTKKVW